MQYTRHQVLRAYPQVTSSSESGIESDGSGGGRRRHHRVRQCDTLSRTVRALGATKQSKLTTTSKLSWHVSAGGRLHRQEHSNISKPNFYAFHTTSESNGTRCATSTGRGRVGGAKVIDAKQTDSTMFVCLVTSATQLPAAQCCIVHRMQDRGGQLANHYFVNNSQINNSPPTMAPRDHSQTEPATVGTSRFPEPPMTSITKLCTESMDFTPASIATPATGSTQRASSLRLRIVGLSLTIFNAQ